MEDTIAAIFSDIEAQTTSSPLSSTTLSNLHSLLTHHSQTLTDNNASDTNNPFWDEFSSRGLPITSLITPIVALMDDTASSVSVLASNVYLLLFLSPNAPVFSLFTPVSFMSFLHCIRRNLKKKKDGCSPNLPVNRKRKGKSVRISGSGSGSSEGGGEEREGVEVEFDVDLLFSVLERLRIVLGLVHLGRFSESFKCLVQTVVELVVLGADLCENNGRFCKKLFDVCGGILRLVLSPEHGDEGTNAAEVLKCVSPLILSTKLQSRMFGVLFVKNEMISLGKGSDLVQKAVVNLPRYLIQKAPEKSDARALAVESIMEIVKVMEVDDQVGFIHYVVKMGQGKSNLRYLAVDLILKIMSSLEEVSNSWKSMCLEALIQRCSDSVAGIRARALSSLAQLVGNVSSNEEDCILLKKALGFEKGNDGRANDLLRKRCTDEKAAVRKAALLLATKLMTLAGSSLDLGVVKMMGMACSDPLVSIRKTAISAISEALRTYAVKSVITEWLHSVPRLITDSETSIQEEIENLFMELVLDRVSRVGCATINNAPTIQQTKVTGKSFRIQLATMYGEGVLDLLEELCNGEVAPWVKKICTSLGKKKRLKPKIATALQNFIKTSESLWLSHSMPIDNWTAPAGTWLLLSQVSSFIPKAVDWEFLHHHWKLVDKDGSTANEFPSSDTDSVMHEVGEGMELSSISWAGDRVLLLQTIANVSVELSPEPAAELAHDLVKRIEEFNMHSTEVNAHMKALKTLCRRKAMHTQEADALITTVADQILSKASRIIDRYLSEEQNLNKENALLTPPIISSKKGKNVVTSSKLLFQANTAVYTIGSLLIICPSMEVKGIVPVLHSMITSGTDESRSNKLPGSRIFLKRNAPSLFNQAWITMGKICLADGKLAKRYIPLFIQELEKSDCAALRNNIIVMMADFCVRYTALVDCYIAKITKGLRDSCELVRRQTFILLSRLLQTDYVKWRGVLFLRFLLSLVDESEKIRQLADFLFGNILKAKAPLLAYNSFVEAVFVLNDCHAHTTNNKYQSSKAENRLFSIRGNDERSRSKRMHIYVSLLKQMAPEHLLATFAKICAEILAAVSDGILNIDDPAGQSVLQDAFKILTCKEIRLPSNHAPTADTAGIDEEGGDGTTTSVARGRAITQVVKKGLIQNTIPIFIELKRLLENKTSPLIGSLMDCLRVLLKDYKNEIDDLLVADKQLRKEIIYDIEKYDTSKAKSSALEAMATMKRSEKYHTPNGSGPSKVKKVHSDSKVASAMADVAAKSVARSVLKVVNQGAMTPPLSALNIPKLKTSGQTGVSRGRKSAFVIESLKKRQIFDCDEEN